MNASVSTNWSKTVAILEAATFVGGNIIGGNFQFLPGFCRWCGALLTPMLGAVVLFCLNDFVHRGGAPLESLAMVQLLCLSFKMMRWNRCQCAPIRLIICELAICSDASFYYHMNAECVLIIVMQYELNLPS